DRVDLMHTQEGGNGFQASRMGRELSDQAGIGFGSETDADPVGARADVDAGGARMLHGQRFGPGRLFLAKGFTLDLGPGLAAAVGLALGLSLSLLAAGRRGGGWWVSGRRCGHKRPPEKRRGEGIDVHAPRRCAGEVAVTDHNSLLQTGTARSRVGAPGPGS